MIIIISNAIPPIAPAITGTAPEPVAVVGGGGVVDDGVDTVFETSDEVLVDGLIVEVAKYEPLVLVTVTILNNERY